MTISARRILTVGVCLTMMMGIASTARAQAHHGTYTLEAGYQFVWAKGDTSGAFPVGFQVDVVGNLPGPWSWLGGGGGGYHFEDGSVEALYNFSGGLRRYWTETPSGAPFFQVLAGLSRRDLSGFSDNGLNVNIDFGTRIEFDYPLNHFFDVTFLAGYQYARFTGATTDATNGFRFAVLYNIPFGK